MSEPAPSPAATCGEREMIPLSALNQYLFCPRRAALIHIEGIFKDNHHTLRGDLIHEHADLPGYEVREGITLLRALPVFSERLGLNGKCDLVEVEGASTSNPRAGIAGFTALRPVEFKLGKRRKWENDDVQLCAQALCLEEMFAIPVPRGAVFHADSRRRREVGFTPELRATTRETIAGLHALLQQAESSDREASPAPLPPAVLKPACPECSLYSICLPELAGAPDRIARAARDLFRT
ncbi:MAG: CRISPR-associated protein Cas4 [Limisphaerales bacterium]